MLWHEQESKIAERGEGAPAGRVVYQVVAYRTDGENSAVASVSVS